MRRWHRAASGHASSGGPLRTLVRQDGSTTVFTTNSTGFDPCIEVVGPMPPPVNGQGAATLRFVEELRSDGFKVRSVDTSVGASQFGLRRMIRKVSMNMKGTMRALMGNGLMYISVQTGRGMWLTIGVCAAARIRRRSLVLHHHSYDYVTERRPRAVALARVSGHSAVHIVLGDKMARELRRSVPEFGSMRVLNNAGLVDPALLDVSVGPGATVLGHLSNLCADKGIDDVVRLAVAVRRAGLPVRLIIGGPVEDDVAAQALRTAELELGESFQYVGPVSANEKAAFFRSITHFVFPTRYRNEAAPFVVLEALASGRACLVCDRGCIGEQVTPHSGLVVSPQDNFVEAALRYLMVEPQSRVVAGDAARARFTELKVQSDNQFARLLGEFREKASR